MCSQYSLFHYSWTWQELPVPRASQASVHQTTARRQCLDTVTIIDDIPATLATQFRQDPANISTEDRLSTEALMTERIPQVRGAIGRHTSTSPLCYQQWSETAIAGGRLLILGGGTFLRHSKRPSLQAREGQSCVMPTCPPALVTEQITLATAWAHGPIQARNFFYGATDQPARKDGQRDDRKRHVQWFVMPMVPAHYLVKITQPPLRHLIFFSQFWPPVWSSSRSISTSDINH